MSAPKNLIPRIELSADEQLRLVAELRKRAELAEEFKSSQWDATHDTYWRLYRAEPDFVERTSPWPGASNTFIPIGQVIIEAFISQVFDAMASNDPIMNVTTFDSENDSDAAALRDYYGSYLFESVIPFRHLFNDWLLNTCVDGTAAVKPRWSREYVVRRPREIEEIASIEKRTVLMEGVEIQTEIPGPMTPRVVEYAKLEREERPRVDITDLSHLFVAPDTGQSLDWPECRWYFHRQSLTWDDLVVRRRDAGYANVDDALKSHIERRETTDREASEREMQSVSESATEDVVEVQEWYMRWPLPARYQKIDDSGEEVDVDQKEGDEEGYMEEVIVTFFPSTGKLARIVPLERLYPDQKRPDITTRLYPVPNCFYGIGLPAKLLHINRALNSTWNQRIDYGTLQNIPWYLYDPVSTGLQQDLLGIRPGAGVPVRDPRGVVFPRMNGDYNFWLSAENTLQGWGERVGTISDYTMGRSPSTPNAQKTARGTAMLLQQANIAFSRVVAMLAYGPVELSRRIHELHRRWAPRETAFRVLNRQTGMLRRRTIADRVFQQDVDFQFVINPSRMQEFNTSMQMFQLIAPQLQQYNPDGIREAMRDLFQKGGAKNFDRLWPEDRKPNIVMQEQQMHQFHQAEIQRLAGMLQQAGIDPGAPAQPPTPPPPPEAEPIMPVEPQVPVSVEDDAVTLKAMRRRNGPIAERDLPAQAGNKTRDLIV